MDTLPSPTTLSTARLRSDLALLAQASRALKGQLRRTWTEPMANFQCELSRLQRRITERLVLLAWTRGRYHVRQLPRRGAIPGTDQYYLEDEATGLLHLVRWDPESYRSRVVQRLAPEYTAASAVSIVEAAPSIGESSASSAGSAATSPPRDVPRRDAAGSASFPHEVSH